MVFNVNSSESKHIGAEAWVLNCLYDRSEFVVHELAILVQYIHTYVFYVHFIFLHALAH